MMFKGKDLFGTDIPYLLRMLGATRAFPDSVEFNWGWFAPKFGFELMFERGGYFDQRCSVSICILWGKLNVKLPFKTSIPESCDTPRYGIQIHGNTFWLHLGGKMNDWEQCDSKWITWDLPVFAWVFDWHRVQYPDGSWHSYSFEKRGNEYTEKHPFKYTLKSGEIQNVSATCYVEERQWHRKWTFLKMNKRCINVSFSSEVGERSGSWKGGTSGSWKGGTVGCRHEMKTGESILDCLRRMEIERKF